MRSSEGKFDVLRDLQEQGCGAFAPLHANRALGGQVFVTGQTVQHHSGERGFASGACDWASCTQRGVASGQH
eukprot:10279130-Lingulodinium_polyedra.AAC.1